MRFKNVFCTQLYKDTFSKVLKEDEFTHGDEILLIWKNQMETGYLIL